MSTSEELLRKIDYDFLRKQKSVLLQVIEYAELGLTVEDLDFGDFHAEPYLIGLLNLIDAIQDHAVDQLGIPEVDVFDTGADE